MISEVHFKYYKYYATITDIPFKFCEYIVNGHSAIDWIIERNQVKTDKCSGIVNNPKHWAEEHGKPRYILDLLCSVVNVSMQPLLSWIAYLSLNLRSENYAVASKK